MRTLHFTGNKNKTGLFCKESSANSSLATPIRHEKHQWHPQQNVDHEQTGKPFVQQNENKTFTACLILRKLFHILFGTIDIDVQIIRLVFNKMVKLLVTYPYFIQRI